MIVKQSDLHCSICLKKAGLSAYSMSRFFPLVKPSRLISEWRRLNFNFADFKTWKGRKRHEKLASAKRNASKKSRTQLAGRRFGFCEIVSYAGRRVGKRKGSKQFAHFWTCKCDCGALFESRTFALIGGETQSCGCLMKRRVRESLTIRYNLDDPKAVESQRIKRKLRGLMRSHIRRLKSKGSPKHGLTIEMIGCSIDALKHHIESQFKRGMTWQNHGAKWEIDHIMPLSRFDLTNEAHARMANRYTNLQPLWKEENTAKKDKIINHQAILL